VRVTRARHRDAGFTLVELVIGMVLGTIVLALIVGAVIDMFGSSERSAMKQKSQRATVAAVEQLTSDLRAARAPEREPFYTGSADNLRNLLLFQRNPTNLLVHDLVAATPNRIVFYAELVNSSRRPECVTWAVQGDGSMRRTVRPFSANCLAGGGAALQDTMVMPPPERTRATAASAIPNPFSYRLLQHPASTNPVRPNACTTPTLTNLTTTLQLDQATSVEMDLRSFVAGRVAHGDQELISAVSIVSRQAQEYRFAIGCVA
jgi:prepilin-type N-terminal cleavage/methylation domain-containing protein